MKRIFSVCMAGLLIFSLSACSSGEEHSSSEEQTQTTVEQSEPGTENSAAENETVINAKGAMSPEDALAYMKSTPDLVIVDVATTNRYEENHFEGAIHIPIEELDSEEEDALYMEIPAGRPVLLHCRLGMVVPGAYERILELRNDIPEIAYIDGAPLFDEYNEWLAGKEDNDMQETKLLGGQTPEDALEYMKNTPDLVIVEVNAPEWKLSTGFTGAMYIPYTEMAERYDEIPEGRPVLLHCGGGIVSVDAYEILQEKRPDIPELSYIAGAPPVRAYNEWLANQ